MFSEYRDPRKVRVVCVALEMPDGALTWWHPHFYRYADFLGRKLRDSDRAQRLWWVSEILRLIRAEKSAGEECVAIHIVERTWNGSQPLDRTLARVAVKGSLAPSAFDAP